jgi:hypothetical protein
MAKMVRKSVYVEPRQEALLKQLSRERRISQAELVRQAINRYLGYGHLRTAPHNSGVWEAAYQLMLGLRAQGPLEQPACTWRREDLCEGRLRRHGE